MKPTLMFWAVALLITTHQYQFCSGMKRMKTFDSKFENQLNYSNFAKMDKKKRATKLRKIHFGEVAVKKYCAILGPLFFGSKVAPQRVYFGGGG